MSTSIGKSQAVTAAEWADDVNDMLVTYSRNADDVVAFAGRHGAIAGQFVEITSPWLIAAENGWAVRFNGERFEVWEG